MEWEGRGGETEEETEGGGENRTDGAARGRVKGRELEGDLAGGGKIHQ
jgi:hypothetical protein